MSKGGARTYLLEELVDLLESILGRDPSLLWDNELLDAVCSERAGPARHRASLSVAVVVLGWDLTASGEGFDGGKTRRSVIRVEDQAVEQWGEK
jgi:hypothetical protein